MNPAPTLLSEWISAPVFWTIVACAVVVGLIILWAEFRKAWAEKSAELDRVLEQGPPVRDRCDLESCDRPASVIYDAGRSGGVLYICDYHAAVVRQWVGRSLTAPYDRENGVA